jgi:beta-glucosidase
LPRIIASAPHRQLALRAARESIVLLRNDDNLLPLDKNKVKTIAAIGPHADYAMMGLGYTGESANFVKPIDGLRNRVASDTQVHYARGSGFLESDDEEAGLASAAAAAKKADVAMLFVGTNQLQEGEGRDRPDISLPRVQQRLLRAVVQANSKTVVVILSGGPVSLAGGELGPRGAGAAAPAAVLEMFYAGEEGGNAIAEVLFGEVNPGGKLPYTVYANSRDLPPMTEYDITKGFTYMYFKGRTEYPFGHGLSYTNFEYSNLKISAKEIPASGSVTISVDVQNAGQRTGDEGVQLYVHDVEASVTRPGKELRGFERISLNAGEKRTVPFTIPADKLSFFDEKADAFVTEPGDFEALVGSSSADIRAKGQFRVTSRGQWPK